MTDNRGVPLAPGDRVRISDRSFSAYGVMVAGKDGHLFVRFDGDAEHECIHVPPRCLRKRGP